MKPEKDATINHYKILSEIGKGGMGEVYLARDTKLNRKVALKILPDELAEDKERMSRFIQEAQTASALNHPNIITIHEIGDSENIHYIATEFIDGQTLDKYAKDNRLSFGKVLDIAIQIASALDEAHQAGIVHRDIKPDNIMIRQNGLAKILDFGIAKLSEPPAAAGGLSVDSEDATAIRQPSTSPGMIIGTANYMSPEQAGGKEVDARTDIFSFGVLLYEMITGHLPFSGDSPLEIISSIIKDEPKPIRTEDVPAELVRIVSKSLRKDRDERYQTMKGLLGDLREVKRQMDVEDHLERTVQPGHAESDTRVFQAATAEEADQTTAARTKNDSISIRRSSLGKVLTGLAAILVLSAIGIGYWKYFRTSNQIDSIAVMPFANESGNADVEYLSDGMTEALISSLTEIPNLSVKARSTVFYYKGKQITPKKIGEELGVEAVLLGRVVQRGEDLKVSLELVDTSTLDALWSKSYDRKMSDLVALQREIAQNVLDNLRSKLSSEDQKKLAKTHTSNPEAHQLYLKGRFYWNRRNIEDLKKAETYFRQAIEKDPSYALAYSGLADTYILMPWYGNFRQDEYVGKSEQAALKAVELDSSLAEAHASLSSVSMSRYDWKSGELGLRKSVELNPNYATAHHWLSECLLSQGKQDEALAEIERALTIDPYSPAMNMVKGVILETAKRNDEAIAQGEKTVELYPDFAQARVNLGRFYSNRERYDKAVEQYAKVWELQNEPPEEIARFRAVFEREGWRAFWKARLDYELKRIDAAKAIDENFYVTYSVLAWMYGVVGDKEKAFESLERAYDQREPILVFLLLSQDFQSLDDDPRYKNILQKMALKRPL